MKRVKFCMLLVSAFIVTACHNNILTKRRMRLRPFRFERPQTSNMVRPFWNDRVPDEKPIFGSSAFDFCSQPAHQVLDQLCSRSSATRREFQSAIWARLGGGTNVPFGLQPQPYRKPKLIRGQRI